MQAQGVSQFKATQNVTAKYSIYAYNNYCADKIGHNKWKCISISHDQNQALEEAGELFRSNQFQKIEVKKKFFDSKKDRYAVATCHVFDQNKGVSIIPAIIFSVLMISCVGLVLLEML